MKCSELWLREWVKPNLNREALCDALTMAGLEVESADPVAQPFQDIVVAEVISVDAHPHSEKLKLCKVTIGEKQPLTIICGAANVRAGMKAPLAKINAVMPNKQVITETEFNGILSQGMLCSAAELGLAESSDGLMALSHDAPLGKSLWDYLDLSDHVIDISITPNRGDCLSVKGIAREVSALTNTPINEIKIDEIAATLSDVIPIEVKEKLACPCYVGRIIRNVKIDTPTPVWLKERLRRSGIRSINAVVDVTNYVMLELGQPMHAFDLNKIQQGIEVRLSKQDEIITLLDSSEVKLDSDTLVIADKKSPLAIAGVMGGMDSGVTTLTKDIFLESAYFSPKTIARQRQYYNLNSDSAYRFERGIDFTLQRKAIERATQLILDIAQGEVGPVIELKSEKDLPKSPNIKLTQEKLDSVLGIAIQEQQVDEIFSRLKFTVKKEKNAWLVSVPPYRPDLQIAEDLIEEVARLYGYDNIPTHTLHAALQANHIENAIDLYPLRNVFKAHGYHEVISYSFVDKKLQTLLNPEVTARELVNPITADMTVMRTNLWPGLINALLYNTSRQQHRAKLVEIGSCFLSQDGQLEQTQKIAGLLMGGALPEQWGQSNREADFFDLKGDIEQIFRHMGRGSDLSFQREIHPALHPGQTAGIYFKDKKVGIMGALHPSILKEIDLNRPIFVFELDVGIFNELNKPHVNEISKFPEIRRDIAILVNQAIPAEEIQDTIKMSVGDWLKDIFIFDVYQGKGVSEGKKSIALALIFQHPTRTLVDDEIAARVERVIVTLKGQLGAALRS